MKKFLLLSFLVAAGVTTLSAQDLPKAFSFTVTPDGDKEVVISGLTTDAKENLEFQIDWGDGQLSEVYKLEDYVEIWDPTVYKNVPKGNTITVYANPEAVQYIDGSWAVGDLKWESVDISALTALKQIDVTSNAIKAIDLSNNKALTKLVMKNNCLEGILDISACSSLTYVDFSNGNPEELTNKVTGVNFGDVNTIASLYGNYNPLGTLDLTSQTNLANLYLMGAELTELNVSGLASLTYISVNNCQLSSLDLSSVNTTKAVNIFAKNNNLTDIKLPTAMKSNSRINIDGNRFTFATLPLNPAATTYNYAPQQDIEITADGDKVDISSLMVTAGENPTVATWYNGETALAADADYTVDNGIFTFLKDAEDANVALTNASFPALTLKSNSVSVKGTSGITAINADNEATARYFNLQGIEVANPEAGNIYIRVQGNEATKVIR